MSDTKYFKVPGIAFWNDLYKPDDFMNAQRYKMSLIVNEAAQELIKKYECKGDFKDHESGDKVYTFRRDAQKLIKKKWVSFAPPVIYDKNGKVITEYTYQGEIVTSVNGDVSYEDFLPTGEQPLIGHGSSVILDICVFPTVHGKGTRLQSVKIVELVEFVPNSGADEAQVPEASAAVPPAKAPW